MKGKERTSTYGFWLRIAAVAVICACSLCGCSKISGSDVSSGAEATAPSQSVYEDDTSSQAETTQSETASQSSKSKATSKTTAKSSKESKSKTSSSQTTQSASQSGVVTSQQTAAPQVTTASGTTTAKSEPANATVTSEVITTAGNMDTASSKPAEKTPDEVEYHIYADGYVTKYDELKLKNLTKEQRKAYNALSEGIWKMQKDIKIDFGVLKQDEAADMLYTVLGTMPEVNYVRGTFKVSVSGGYVKKYTMDYTLDTGAASEQHKALRAKASKIIGSLPSGLTDIEKVKAFHDYIIKNCQYTKDGGSSIYTAYGCLVEGKAVCEGYAMAMDYLCEKAGIYSLLISGESTNSSGVTLTHIWNKILIDGKWYNFDITWDDPVSNFGADYVRYDYFAVTDEFIEKTHKVEKNRFGYYPAANSVQENYFIKNGLFIDDMDDADEVLIKAFAKSISEGQICTSVRCGDADTFEAVQSLIMSSNGKTGQHTISGYVKTACERTGKSRDYSGFYMVKSENTGVIAIILK
ncbi:MAG: hypothetical protein K6F91_09535 [Ruminococcus sp.]|nr:hypothetical protein [Ruminococcus sp.]